MCKTTTVSQSNLKDLLLNKTDSIDIRDCYVKTGIENILGTMDNELSLIHI